MMLMMTIETVMIGRGGEGREERVLPMHNGALHLGSLLCPLMTEFRESMKNFLPDRGARALLSLSRQAGMVW